MFSSIDLITSNITFEVAHLYLKVHLIKSYSVYIALHFYTNCSNPEVRVGKEGDLNLELL